MERSIDVNYRLFKQNYYLISRGVRDFATVAINKKSKDLIDKFMKGDKFDDNSIKVKFESLSEDHDEIIIYRYDWQIKFYELANKQKFSYMYHVMLGMLYGYGAKQIQEFVDKM